MITIKEKNNNFSSYKCNSLCLATTFTALLQAKRSTSYDNKCLSVLNLLFTQVISNNLRLDKGTETGYMATIHSYLRQQGDPASNGTDAVHYKCGPDLDTLFRVEVFVQFYFSTPRPSYFPFIF